MRRCCPANFIIELKGVISVGGDTQPMCELTPNLQPSINSEAGSVRTANCLFNSPGPHERSLQVRGKFSGGHPGAFCFLNRFPCFTFQRRNREIGHSARCDLAVVAGVGRHVHGKAVHRHATGYSNTNRCDFPPGRTNSLSPLLVCHATNPNTGFAIDKVCLHAELGQRFDNRPLQQSHVGDGAKPSRPDIDDRLADQLSRTMIGCLAATVGLVNLDTRVFQYFTVGKDVRITGPSPQRDHVRMLKQQKRVGDSIRFPCVEHRAL